MSQTQSTQDIFLESLRKEQVHVSIFLVSGVQLRGQIESFDPFIVVLSPRQVVYKHAISTIVPAHASRTDTHRTSRKPH